MSILSLSIEELNEAGKGFALYRLPFADDYQIISGKHLKGYSPDISFHKGFLFSPFDNAELTACSLIQDELAHSYSEESFLEQVKLDFSGLGNGISVTDTTEESEYSDNVVKAVETLEKGDLKKVVLSKRKVEAFNDHQNLLKRLVELGKAYPETMNFLLYTEEHGLWIGATPEVLIKNQEGVFSTMALAGTQLNEYEDIHDAAWRDKEIEEQAMVSRYIVNCFKKIRLREYEEEGPKTIQNGHLLHLSTIFRVDTNRVSVNHLEDNMLKLLHPTSAVCGMPFSKAKTFILEKENFSRSLYSGFLGPINLGVTQLMVTLRCAKIDKANICYYGGAGITKGSKPEREWMETESKIRVIKNVLNA